MTASWRRVRRRRRLLGSGVAVFGRGVGEPAPAKQPRTGGGLEPTALCAAGYIERISAQRFLGLGRIPSQHVGPSALGRFGWWALPRIGSVAGSRVPYALDRSLCGRLIARHVRARRIGGRCCRRSTSSWSPCVLPSADFSSAPPTFILDFILRRGSWRGARGEFDALLAVRVGSSCSLSAQRTHRNRYHHLELISAPGHHVGGNPLREVSIARCQEPRQAQAPPPPPRTREPPTLAPPGDGEVLVQGQGSRLQRAEHLGAHHEGQSQGGGVALASFASFGRVLRCPPGEQVHQAISCRGWRSLPCAHLCPPGLCSASPLVVDRAGLAFSLSQLSLFTLLSSRRGLERRNKPEGTGIIAIDWCASGRRLE